MGRSHNFLKFNNYDKCNEYDDFSISPIPFSSEDKNDVIKYIENYHLYNYNNLKYRIIK